MLKLLARPAAGTETWPVGLGAEMIPMLQRDQQMWLDSRQMYGAGAETTGIEMEDVAAFACVVLRDEHHRETLRCPLSCSSNSTWTRRTPMNDAGGSIGGFSRGLTRAACS